MHSASPVTWETPISSAEEQQELTIGVHLLAYAARAACARLGDCSARLVRRAAGSRSYATVKEHAYFFSKATTCLHQPSNSRMYGCVCSPNDLAIYQAPPPPSRVGAIHDSALYFVRSTSNVSSEFAGGGRAIGRRLERMMSREAAGAASGADGNSDLELGPPATTRRSNRSGGRMQQDSAGIVLTLNRVASGAKEAPNATAFIEALLSITAILQNNPTLKPSDCSALSMKHLVPLVNSQKKKAGVSLWNKLNAPQVGHLAPQPRTSTPLSHRHHPSNR